MSVRVRESQETHKCVTDCHVITLVVNPLPNNKILVRFKFKAHAEDKINVTQNLNFVLGRVDNILGKVVRNVGILLCSCRLVCCSHLHFVGMITRHRFDVGFQKC